jgi:hypothetical protein
MHQPRVAIVTGPYNEVKAFVDDVHDPVREIEVQFNEWIRCYKGRKRIREQ